MFVKSNMSREVTYHKSRGSVVLKPGTVTFVDDNLVTAKELKDCYGDRINIMSRETVEKYIVETAPQVVEDLIEENEESKAEEVEHKEEPQEDKDAVINGAVSVDPLAELEEVIGEIEIKEPIEPLTSNTGNEEVDSFLNGETNKIPEGTTEISQEEALNLQEEVKIEEPKPVKKPVGKKPGKKMAGKKVTKTSKN